MQADAFMREARALSSAVASSVHETNVLAYQRADIDKARHQMEIRCVAHVMRKVHIMADQKFTSLAEFGCRFHEKLVEVVGKERVPSLPKVWSKAKPQREKELTTKTKGGTQNRGFQEVSAQTTAEEMKDYLGGMGAAIGCVVKLADKAKSNDKRTWVVSSITATTVTLNLSMPDGEESAQEKSIHDFIEKLSVVHGEEQERASV